MSKKKKFELTDEQMNFITIGAIGVGIFAIYKLFNKVGDSVKNVFGDYSDEKELVENIEKEQKIYEDNGLKLTYPLFQYKSDAEILKSAMAIPGTKEDIIYNVFSKMKNDLDISELIKQYGTHLYAISQINYRYLDLSGWINEELTTSEIEKLNKILANNNITFKF